jgi:hypothetical protein
MKGPITIAFLKSSHSGKAWKLEENKQIEQNVE